MASLSAAPPTTDPGAPAPAAPLDPHAARELVGVFFDGLVEEPTDGRVAELALRHPDAARAALCYLRARYLDGVPPDEPWETVQATTHVLALMLARGGAATEDALLALALDVPSVGAIRPLTDLVSLTVDADRLARALIAALDGDRDARSRASDLNYHTIDASAGALTPHADLAIVLAEKLRLHDRAERRRAGP